VTLETDLSEVVRLRNALAMSVQMVKEQHAEIQRNAEDAAIGQMVWKFIDRMTDVSAPDDSADKILSDFVGAVNPLMDAAMRSVSGEEVKS
jgi:hypothetical protein